MKNQELEDYVLHYFKAIEPHHGIIITELTEQEKKEQDEYILKNNLPF